MINVPVDIKVKPVGHDVVLPTRADAGSAGLDLYAHLSESVTIEPGQRVLIPLGFATEFSPLYEVQIRSRSGLAAKFGVIVLNAPGTIDSSYRDEWKVILHNTGNAAYTIKNGDRVAQAIVAEVIPSVWRPVDYISPSARNGGFGSSGR